MLKLNNALHFDLKVKTLHEEVIESIRSNLENDTTLLEIPKLEISPGDIYSSEDLLLLSFNVIVKRGSWEYFKLSKMFYKAQGSYQPITAEYNIASNSIIQDDITQFEHKIYGVLDTLVDFDEDGFLDYIFKFNFQKRSDSQSEYHFLRFDGGKLFFQNIMAYENLSIGECEKPFGLKESIKFQDRGRMYIHGEKSSCSDGIVKTDSSYLRKYFWSEDSESFVLSSK